jgi:hypothetical protein
LDLICIQELDEEKGVEQQSMKEQVAQKDVVATLALGS